MLPFTKQKMNEYALILPPGTNRCQCFNIANLHVGAGGIAQAMIDDHVGSSDPHRAAKLMVDAGCATEIGATSHLYGIFEFEDGSKLK